MIYLTLATGTDRWEPEGASHRLRNEGELWLMAADPKFDSHIVLKQEIADWCFDNIGAYRIIEHAPSGKFGPDADDSWRIEFKTATDMAYFKLRWM